MFNNGGSNSGFTFSFSYGITGDGDQSLYYLGIGINNTNDKSLVYLFPIDNIDNIDLNDSEINFNITYENLNNYLTDNTNYFISVVGQYKQNDVPTLYQITSFSQTPFLYNAP